MTLKNLMLKYGQTGVILLAICLAVFVIKYDSRPVVTVAPAMKQNDCAEQYSEVPRANGSERLTEPTEPETEQPPAEQDAVEVVQPLADQDLVQVVLPLAEEDSVEGVRAPVESEALYIAPPSKECQVNRCGGRPEDDYGLWMLCTNWLTPQTIIYSFGIGPDATFDVEAAEKYGSSVFCLDPTLDQERFEKVKTKAAGSSWDKGHLLHFYPYGLGTKNEVVTFVRDTPLGSGRAQDADANTENEEYTVEGQIYTMPTVMSKLGHAYVHVLKADIEGSEFTAFHRDNLDWMRRMQPQQILMEFHVRFFDNNDQLRQDVLSSLADFGYRKVWESRTKWECLLIKQ